MDERETRWPALPVAAWQDTRDTLQLWTQIVGKLRMALAPHLNHWWHVPLYVDARGLTTGLMPAGAHGLEVRFDFVARELVFARTDGVTRAMALRPRSVADFYREFVAVLAELEVPARIRPVPVELPEVIPFDEDETHASYDADAAARFWRSLVTIAPIMARFRGEWEGKSSPVHFFWGAFDLATSRFSGRPAPRHPGGVPNCPDWVMHEAYDAEVSSAGYWPGGADEGAFYSYAYPEPAGFRDRDLGVPGAFFDAGLGEFLLPYRTVREADDPDGLLLAFLRATFRAGAETGGWPGVS
ncbi:DUF5996 family protein [Microbacterium sp.]|uniref:DUF5996 family protein n=1 Tax=Microbacterium sp. TaxID=51671 RepID=UPI002896C40E|nr:DUF5996 family protein [Microbacterium sp.]